MEERDYTTKEEMRNILAMLQEFQREMFGIMNIELDARVDNDGDLYMTFYTCRGDQFVKGNCYEFWSYEKNMQAINDYKEELNKLASVNSFA